MENKKICDHEWIVFSTAIIDRCLLLECTKCKAFGIVPHPTSEEWNAGFYAPEKPYRWYENSRVEIQTEKTETHNKNTREQTKPYVFRDWYIPSRMMEGVYDYLHYGYRPGSFLKAIFANDLVKATGQADDENLRNIPAYAAFLYNDAPQPSWGSYKKVDAWIKYKQEQQQREERERKDNK